MPFQQDFLMNRREFGSTIGFAGVGLLSGCDSTTSSNDPAAKTLRMIRTQSLASLDPIWTTAPGTRDYGYMVYDQLIGIDAHYVPQPQMAQGWIVEDNGKSYLFGLRAGLKFHDGVPVRSQDCIASIRRWAAKDGFGMMAMKLVTSIDLIDERHFRIRLKQPFPLLLAALGKSAAPACLIMPERIAKTDPTVAITESIGSGPFRFLKYEFVPGSKAAFARFEGYVPRTELASGLAGNRKASIDRIEWTQIGDASTAMAALQAGEQDYWDAPPPDLIAVLKADPNIAVAARYPSGVNFMLQVNHLQPPFNNVAVRRALAMAIDQRQILRPAVSDPATIKTCHSFYGCNTPYATDEGGDILKVADTAKARAALIAAGYKNEKVVLLTAGEGPAAPLGAATEDLMRRLGLNVELITLDFASITQRRTNRESVDKGGWSAFLTGWLGTDLVNPGVHPMLRGAGLEGYAGWCDDPQIETLRNAWATATTAAEQTKLASDLQIEAFKVLPYIPLGMIPVESAYRKKVTGVEPALVNSYWTLGKST